MPDEYFDRVVVELPPEARRWPTGLAALIGLLAGTLAGLAIGLVPLGAAAGIALGVGADALLARVFNVPPRA